jgi:hypothetical protein
VTLVGFALAFAKEAVAHVGAAIVAANLSGIAKSHMALIFSIIKTHTVRVPPADTK